MMQYTGKILMALGILGSLMLTSCNKDVFSEEEYDEHVKKSSPVDSVDATHTWELAQDHTYVVQADVNVEAKSVLILSDNPLTELNSEILSQTAIEDGGRVMMTATVPTRISDLYAALVDADGLYTVVNFPVASTEISFENVKSASKQKPLKAYLVQQKLVYCFEEEMPEPGDYDYNDVVLRLSREIVNSRHLIINVELAAVGGEKQLAAGLRLVGYKAEDIDSVTIEGGGSFDLGGSHYDVPLEKTASPLFESSSLLQSGRNGEAVIYLFEDAHWAMGDDLEVINQIFQRKRYNVSKLYSDDYMVLPTRTETYHVYFKEGQSINDFTPSMFDPFILSPYYGAIWEIHCYRDREAQVTREYTLTKSKNLPWALMIPYASFRYPLEGVNIGFYKNGALFGAYMNLGCSFGEWAMDHTKCLDWYTSPTFNQVF
ncbi:MAG: LruC domain-containing protein [Prevotella sp.]|nr:LruC domain-containing protein [Prevotella sp.]